MKAWLFIIAQYLIPQRWLSRLAGCVAETTITWIKNPMIRWFIKRYQVDMSIAADPTPENYAHFNDFFTRALADGQRPIDPAVNSIICPADGCISQLGDIRHGRIFQARWAWWLSKILSVVLSPKSPYYSMPLSNP